MSKASNFLESAVLNHFFRGQSVTAPATVYVALYLSDPTDYDTGTEVSGAGYARQQIIFAEPSQVSERGQITNQDAIYFPVAKANWGNVTHFGIRTASSGGNLLASAPLNIAKEVSQGDQIVLNAGAIRITLE